MRLGLGIWALVGVAVVLATRTLVYALAPQSVLLAELADNRAVGPHLTVPLVGILAAAAVLAATALTLAVSAVRVRLQLEGRRLVSAPRAPARRPGRPRGGTVPRHLVRLRDARVDHPLARGARLARAPLPPRACPSRRDPDPGRALAPRRRHPRCRRAPARLGAAALRTARSAPLRGARPCTGSLHLRPLSAPAAVGDGRGTRAASRRRPRSLKHFQRGAITVSVFQRGLSPSRGGRRRAPLVLASRRPRRARRRVGGLRPRARQPARLGHEEPQLYSLAVPTEKEGADDDEDRPHRSVRVLDRLVRPDAPAGSARCSRPGPARTP